VDDDETDLFGNEKSTLGGDSGDNDLFSGMEDEEEKKPVKKANSTM